MDQTFELNLSKDFSLKVDHLWLRDHCKCELCYNISNSNRIGNILDIPDDIRVKSFTIENEKLHVVWSDDHKSEYKLKFLMKYQPMNKLPPKTKTRLWNSKSFDEIQSNCHFDYEAYVSSSEVKKEVLKTLHKYGVVFIDGVNPTEADTGLAVQETFPIQKNFFGELWTFSEAMQDHHDTAYTNVYLAPHNDHTYFNDAGGLLVLHCLHHDGTGGENYLIDSFQVANKIKREHPESYERLTKTIVTAEYKEPGRHHKHSAPIFNTDPVTGEMTQIRYNMDDRVPFNTVPADEIRDFYFDLKLLTRELQSKENQIVFKLKPGTVMIFDNWRLLHGRLFYTGHRKMAGCFVSRSEFQSALRINRIIE